MKKPVYAIAIVLALIISVTAGVPSVRAQVQEVIHQLIHFREPNGSGIIGYDIDWDYVAFNPTYLPSGWKAAAVNIGEGDVRFIGIIYTARGADSSAGFAALIQRKTPSDFSLPDGKTLQVNGLNASLRVGASVHPEEVSSVGVANWLRAELRDPTVKELVWVQGNTLLDLVSNLDESSLVKIAESMQPAAP